MSGLGPLAQLRQRRHLAASAADAINQWAAAAATLADTTPPADNSEHWTATVDGCPGPYGMGQNRNRRPHRARIGASRLGRAQTQRRRHRHPLSRRHRPHRDPSPNRSPETRTAPRAPHPPPRLNSRTRGSEARVLLPLLVWPDPLGRHKLRSRPGAHERQRHERAQPLSLCRSRIFFSSRLVPSESI